MPLMASSSAAVRAAPPMPQKPMSPAPANTTGAAGTGGGDGTTGGVGSGDGAGVGVVDGGVVTGVGSTGEVPPQLKENRQRARTAGTLERGTLSS